MGLTAEPIKELKPDQLAFVETYNGDIAATARALGIPKHRAYWLLRQAAVADAIREREAADIGEELEATIANRFERMGFWTDVMRDESLPMDVRLGASKMLGEAQADFTKKVKHEGDASTVNILVQNVDLEDRCAMLGKAIGKVFDTVTTEVDRAVPEFLT